MHNNCFKTVLWPGASVVAGESFGIWVAFCFSLAWNTEFIVRPRVVHAIIDPERGDSNAKGKWKLGKQKHHKEAVKANRRSLLLASETAFGRSYLPR